MSQMNLNNGTRDFLDLDGKLLNTLTKDGSDFIYYILGREVKYETMNPKEQWKNYNQLVCFKFL